MVNEPVLIENQHVQIFSATYLYFEFYMQMILKQYYIHANAFTYVCSLNKTSQKDVDTHNEMLTCVH